MFDLTAVCICRIITALGYVSTSFYLPHHKDMKTNKRELLRKLIQEDLWKKLSPEEVRLYLVLITFAVEVKGTGRLGSKDLEGCLGPNFSRSRLEKAALDLENLHLGKADISSRGPAIEFEFLKGSMSCSKSKSGS